MRYLNFILSVIVILFIILIIIENHEPLSKTVYFKFDMFSLHYRTVDISIYYIAAVPFLLGVVITGIYGSVERFRFKRQIKDLYKIIRDKEKELNSLRDLPNTSNQAVSGRIDDTIK